MLKTILAFLVVLSTCVSTITGVTLITGGLGNKPLRDPGWPAGVATLFNHTGRIAWWEGPPFGGGEWHSECRGDARSLNTLLAEFARLDIAVKRVVVHDGTGRSFWIAPNNEPEKVKEAKIDWRLTVWQSDNWERLKQLPADLNPTKTSDTSPPAQIDVYTASIRWEDVTVPTGMEVLDNRLVAHGFTTNEGVVLEGKVNDVNTGQPIPAKIRLELVVPDQGYKYVPISTTISNDKGKWVLKNAPPGWFRVVAEAEGFVPRVIGYLKTTEEPCWQSFDSELAPAVAISGRVTDSTGRPLSDVEVQLGNVKAVLEGRYESPDGYTFQTDADGRFIAKSVPQGEVQIWVNKPGFVRPGLGPTVKTPATNVELQMMPSARVVVTVDFTGKQVPEGYLVELSPVGGNVIGSHGGTGNIDVKNQMVFENLPPGNYVLKGRPNPGSKTQETEPFTLELKGGMSAEATLKAR